MARSVKIRAKTTNGVTVVKSLMTHPMETGRRRDSKSGEPIPANFIQQVTCKHAGAVVMTALWGGGVSKNPYLSFKFEGGAKGETITISWVDNRGNKDSGTATIS